VPPPMARGGGPHPTAFRGFGGGMPHFFGAPHLSPGMRVAAPHVAAPAHAGGGGPHGGPGDHH
jgi:hypothetical protein